jgi:hypothetical protein
MRMIVPWKKLAVVSLFTMALAVVGIEFASTDVLKVTLYEHDNYNGGLLQLGTGDQGVGDFNDLTTSIKVPVGLDAIFFADGDKRQGTKMLYLRGGMNVANLVNSYPDMNDAISRVIVCKSDDAACLKPVFSQQDRGGANGYMVSSGDMKELTGDYPLPNPKLPPGCPCGEIPFLPPLFVTCQPDCPLNDSFSSLTVPAGWKIKFCQEHFMGKPCAWAAGPTWVNLSYVDGQDFNDTVSSWWAEGPAEKQTLMMFYHGERGDAFTSATAAGWRSALDAGYQQAREEARVLPTQASGTVPLKLYWHPGRQDNFITATAESEKAAKDAGYQLVRTEGYVYPKQVEGTVPLKLYYSSEKEDNLTTATAEGEKAATSAGYAFVRIEGYAYPIDGESAVSAQLPPPKVFGWVYVGAKFAQGADIYADDAWKGTGEAAFPLEVGKKAVVKARKAGWKTVSQTVEMKWTTMGTTKALLPVSVIFNSSTKLKTVITADSKPSGGATIYIDGKDPAKGPRKIENADLDKGITLAFEWPAKSLIKSKPTDPKPPDSLKITRTRTIDAHTKGWTEGSSQWTLNVIQQEPIQPPQDSGPGQTPAKPLPKKTPK